MLSVLPLHRPLTQRLVTVHPRRLLLQFSCTADACCKKATVELLRIRLPVQVYNPTIGAVVHYGSLVIFCLCFLGCLPARRYEIKTFCFQNYRPPSAGYQCWNRTTVLVLETRPCNWIFGTREHHKKAVVHRKTRTRDCENHEAHAGHILDCA